jgi:hypothetical protein
MVNMTSPVLRMGQQMWRAVTCHSQLVSGQQQHRIVAYRGAALHTRTVWRPGAELSGCALLFLMQPFGCRFGPTDAAFSGLTARHCPKELGVESGVQPVVGVEPEVLIVPIISARVERLRDSSRIEQSRNAEVQCAEGGCTLVCEALVPLVAIDSV